jgi:hypothetical protein
MGVLGDSSWLCQDVIARVALGPNCGSAAAAPGGHGSSGPDGSVPPMGSAVFREALPFAADALATAIGGGTQVRACMHGAASASRDGPAGARRVDLLSWLCCILVPMGASAWTSSGAKESAGHSSLCSHAWP